MKQERKIALITGILFIIGTAAGILSVVFTGSILSGSDYLTKISANENQMMAGSLFVLLMGLSLALVPAVLFPVLKKQNEVLAVGYVVFRGALETFTYIAMVITWLFLIILSREFSTAAGNTSYFQTLGDLLLKGNESISSILIIVFGLGALMLYSVFFQSRLIPRWLSGWGIIAIVLHLTTGFLIIFHRMNSFSTINSIMNFPIFLQEMVMAAWLIVKGFNLTEGVGRIKDHTISKHLKA